MNFRVANASSIGIARALILKPKVVICDEPRCRLWTFPFKRKSSTCSKELQAKWSLALVFIAHDLRCG